MTTDPHHAEYAGAIAGMADIYGSRWVPRPGDRARCPRAFGGGYQEGVIAGREDGAYLVDTAEGRLLMYLEELERITN
jgi:hypothetical protein